MTEASSSRSNGRKRARPAFLVEDNTPSDPALFSSDPVDASAEHYFAPRRKKQYRGTWWQNGKEKRHRKAFERNVDSGVFMGSDSSLESLDSENLENIKSDDLDPNETSEGVSSPRSKPTGSFSRPVQISEPWSVIEARRRITSFAESGENIEILGDSWAEELFLADLGLPYLTDDMLTPLRSLVRQPLWKGDEKFTRQSRRNCDDDDSTESSPFSLDSDEDLAQFDETFDLRLDSNALLELPSSIFALSGLRQMSVRNNNLNTLSPNVANLKKLERLNLAGNRLRWLPGEVIDLIHCADSRREHLLVTARHNPLLQPFSYVGFRSLVEKSSMVQSQDLSLFPRSIAELRGRIEVIKQLKPSNELPEKARKLQCEQSSWLLRLYEHCLANPELIWLGGVQLADIPKEDELEMIKRYAPFGTPSSNIDLRGLAFSNMSLGTGSVFRRQTLLMASTSICYLDISGKPVDRQMLLPNELPMDQTVLPACLVDLGSGRAGLPESAGHPPITPSSCLQQSATERSQVHSLFSLALASAATVPELEHLPDLLSEDAPDTVRRGLDHAIQTRRDGGRTCYACERPYIVPRAVWLEYHVLNSSFSSTRSIENTLEDLFVPFLRTVCSWGCAPQPETSAKND